MTLATRVQRTLAVYPGEGRRIALLSLHSLSNGVFIAFFFAGANGLFLELFSASALPWAYVASSLVGYAAASLFSRYERRLPFPRLLTRVLAALLAAVAFFWVAFAATGNRWIAFAMFVSVIPAMGLLALEFWGLAMRLLDLRQSKRLFGLVGAGEVAATIVGFLLVPVLLGFLPGAVHLLPIAGAGLAGCLAVAGWIFRRFPEQVAGGGPVADRGARDARGEAPEEADARLRELLRSRYFVLLAGLMVVSVLVSYYVDFSFLSQLKVRYPTSEALARFLGFFFAGVKGTELLLRTFAAGRMLTVFGLRFGLLFLPVALLACVGLVLGGGSVVGSATVLTFALIAFTKLVWLVVRDSIFEPSFRTLYQPLEAGTRLAFQVRVEGSVKQGAILLVGLALLVFSRTGALRASSLFVALVPLVASWLVLAWMAHADYRRRLLANLAPRGEEPEAEGEGQAVARVLARRPRDAAAEALTRLSQIDRQLAVQAAVALLERSPRHRVRCLELLARLRAEEGRGAAERLLDGSGEADPEVRSAARRVLARVTEVDRVAASEERIAAAAASDDPDERYLAALALGRTTIQQAGARLAELLWDREPEVRRAALVAAGESGSPGLRRRIVAHLSEPAFSAAAVRGAAAAGEAILDDLDALLFRSSSGRELRYRTLKVCQEIGGEAAVAVLFDGLASPDPQAQGQALSALSRLGSRSGPGREAEILSRIEQVVATAAWNLAALVDLAGFQAGRWVTESLGLELKRNRATLYSLLKLVFEPRAIDLAERELEHGGPETAVYALEILDLVIAPELKPLVVPVLERLPPAQTVSRLEAVAPQERLGPLERLRAVVHRDYSRIRPWTRACALHALGNFPDERLMGDCLAHLFNPDPLVQEIAACGLYRRDPGAYRRHARRLVRDRPRLDQIVDDAASADDHRRAVLTWRARSRFGRTVFFRRMPHFRRRPPETAVHLAEISAGEVYAPQEVVAAGASAGATYRAVMEGRITSETTGRDHLPGAWLGRSDRAGPYRAAEASAVVRLEEQHLFEFLADHPDLVALFLELETEGLALDPDAQT